MQPAPPAFGSRRRQVLLSVLIVVTFVAGCFAGGIIGASARDSVANAKLSAARTALEACQALEIVAARAADHLIEAFAALADEDPVRALNSRAAAGEYLAQLEEMPACTFDD